MNRYNSNHHSQSIYVTFTLHHSSNPQVQALLQEQPIQAVFSDNHPLLIACLYYNTMDNSF